ncbi:fatty acid desaturase [Hansschlegelia zhihuaiae]|uniref:Fatty acid desaturase n=2 Tax=Hansschlegelia zhihuaiae TaxID=405005 RepID=A0A4Q0MP51_9HYPH|nr:fatty acid desaturase [Hansschlegelia zhihuaiae]
MKTASMTSPAPDRNLPAAAYKLCADLVAAKPAIYWADLIATALVAYAGFALAVLASSTPLRAAAFVVSALAFYRGVSFIHEVSHLRPQDVPGFKAGYNALIGVPFLVPSLMYEGVHNLHHAKTRYGTVQDPEYMPLGHGALWQVVAFVVVSALAPFGLLIRFAVLTPIAALVPPFRRIVVERFSALAINPLFRREMPTGGQLRLWLWLEALCSVWAVTLVALTIAGVISPTVFWTGLALGSAVALVNQIRTLVAHHWENEGEEMTPTEQFLDTVNVPPPATLPMLWAPVGLRYHALHHLLPRLPYHNLGQAHARLMEMLPEGSPYAQGNSRGFWEVVVRLVAFIRGRRAARPAEIVPGE